MQELGFNYRITDLQAALGISQLKKLDSFVAKRRALVEAYKELFACDERFSLLEEKRFSQASFHLFPVLLNNAVISLSKKEIYERLKGRGLSLQVHYIPVHLQPYYSRLGHQAGDYPHAELYYQKTLSLPLYPQLTVRDIKCIVNIVKEVVS
jgi:dTDP-4-amino-4,6-dideoxygalactose transaminase